MCIYKHIMYICIYFVYRPLYDSLLSEEPGPRVVTGSSKAQIRSGQASSIDLTSTEGMDPYSLLSLIFFYTYAFLAGLYGSV
jgi:hypothetical protein